MKDYYYQTNNLVISDWCSTMRFTNLPDANNIYNCPTLLTVRTSFILCKGSGPWTCEEIIKTS